MSTAYSSSDYYSGTLPLAVPCKDDYSGYYHGGHDSYSVSPPEYASEHGSATSSSGGSYSASGYSASASYAGSTQGDYDSAGSATGIDLDDYLHQQFSERFNPVPLDKAMVTQAQT